MKNVRVCVYPKDIQRMTGRSERYGRRLLNEMKVYLGKSSHQFITIEEFAEYSGINEDLIKEYLQNTT